MTPMTPLRRSTDRSWVRCLSAIPIVAAAAGVRIIFLPQLGNGLPWLTFYPAVILAAIYGGLSAGALATALSCATVLFLWPAFGSNVPFILNGLDWLGLALFCIIGLVISEKFGVIHRARMKHAEEELQRDARERKRLEEGLINAEERWKIAVEAARLGTWHWQIAGETWLGLSDAGKTMLGLQHDVVMNYDALIGAFHPEDRAAVDRALQRAVELKSNCHTDCRAMHPDGSIRWLTLVGHIFCDEMGAATMMEGVVIDHTEAKHRQDALAEGGRKFTALFEDAPVGMAVISPEGHFMKANRPLCELLGYTPAELLARRFQDIIHADDIADDLRNRGQMLDGHLRTYQDQKRLLHKSGQTIWVLSAVSLIRGAAGEPLQFIVQTQDISERKRLETAFESLRLQAEAASEAKSVFVTTMNHEIRTPLNGVVGFSSLLLDTSLDAEQRDFANSVRNSAESLLSIVNDILDFSRIEAGRIDLDHGSFDLREAVENCLDLVTPDADRKKIELCSLVEETCPEYVIGDVTRFRQILTNLLSNAVKFTERGEIAVLVEAAAPADGQTNLRVEVLDTGIGMPQEQQRRIFEPFTQADTGTTRRFGGTGLGLTISRRLVELMGGTIGVESAPGRGSKFSFDIPLGVDVRAAANKGEDPRKALVGLRIAVVDDNETNRRYLGRQVEFWGAQARSFSSGKELLASLRDGGRFDVCLMDYHMPEMDGFETTRRMRRLTGFESLPVFLLSSGNTSSHDFPERYFAKIFSKPINARLLRTALIHLRSGDLSDYGIPPRISHQLAQVHPLRILLAEDNQSNQKLVVLMLGKYGYRVDVAGDGNEALTALRLRPYDVVLLDLQMPKMDGIETTRAIREQIPKDRQPWIIALTAHAAETSRDLCIEGGMNDFITKPIQRDLLILALQRVPPARKAAAEVAAGHG